MSSTQTFANFVEEKTYSSHRQSELDFFDRCCEHEASINEVKQTLQSKLKARKVTTPVPPSLVHHITEQTTRSTIYQVPRADSSNLPSDRSPWTYPSFPMLDITLFSRPRPIDVRYMRDVDEARRKGIAADFENAFAQQDSSRQFSVEAQIPRGTDNPVMWAKYLMRCIYASWFELQCICIPHHHDIPQAILQIFVVLQYMTSQGILPDERIYRSILVVCGKYSKKYEAQLIFDTMKRAGVKPSAVTYGAYASALAEATTVAAVAVAATGASNDDNHMTLQDMFAGCGEVVPPHRHSSDTPISVTSSSSPTATASSTTGDALMDAAQDKHGEKISECKRERVRWDTLVMGFNNTCQLCSYQMTAAEVMAGWKDDPNAYTTKCVACSMTFVAMLKVMVVIDKHGDTTPSSTDASATDTRKRTKMAVPLLCPLSMRKELSVAIATFAGDFADPNVFRTLHQALFWNLLWYFSILKDPVQRDFLVGSENAASFRPPRDSLFAELTWDPRLALDDNAAMEAERYHVSEGKHIRTGSSEVKIISDPTVAAAAAALRGSVSSPDDVAVGSPERIARSAALAPLTGVSTSVTSSSSSSSISSSARRQSFITIPLSHTGSDAPVMPHGVDLAGRRSTNDNESTTSSNGVTNNANNASNTSSSSASSSSSSVPQLDVNGHSNISPGGIARREALDEYAASLDELNARLLDVGAERAIMDQLRARNIVVAMELFLANRARFRPDLVAAVPLSSSSLMVTPTKVISSVDASLPPSAAAATVTATTSEPSDTPGLVIQITTTNNDASSSSSSSISQSSPSPRSPRMSISAFTETPALLASPSLPASALSSSSSSSSSSTSSAAASTSSVHGHHHARSTTTLTASSSPPSTVNSTKRSPSLPSLAIHHTPIRGQSGRSILPSWQPTRSITARRWLRSMFDELWIIGGRHYRCYNPDFVDAYTQALPLLQAPYRDQVTAMDRAPSKQVVAFELTFMLRTGIVPPPPSLPPPPPPLSSAAGSSSSVAPLTSSRSSSRLTPTSVPSSVTSSASSSNGTSNGSRDNGNNGVSVLSSASLAAAVAHATVAAASSPSSPPKQPRPPVSPRSAEIMTASITTNSTTVLTSSVSVSSSSASSAAAIALSATTAAAASTEVTADDMALAVASPDVVAAMM